MIMVIKHSLPSMSQVRLTTFLTGSRRFSVAQNPCKSHDGIWLHKLNEPEKIYLYSHRAGIRFNALTYTLNSRKEISPEVMHQTVTHMQRKFPPCQLTLRERNGEVWFFKPEQVNIDFKVLEKGTTKLDAINEISYPFDEVNGPLWRYRMVPAKETDPCERPELKKDFPFQYYLINCQNHCTIDATTNHNLALTTIDILEAHMSGGDLPDDSPVGDFISNEEYEDLDAQCKARLLKDPERLESLKNDIIKSNKTPILLKSLARPNVDISATKYIIVNVNQDVIQKFAEKCKENGVTFGNGFQTVNNTALVELVQDAGATDESYDMSMMYSVDMRRYLKKRELPILGCHVRYMSSLITLNKNVRDNFWGNCRMINQKNKDLLKSNSVLEQAVVRQMFLPDTPSELFFNSKPQVTKDLSFNNVGAYPVYGSYKEVVITDVENYGQVHRLIYPIYIHVHSYGGNMKYMISYATDWMSDATANLLVDKITSIVEYFSQ